MGDTEWTMQLLMWRKQHASKYSRERTAVSTATVPVTAATHRECGAWETGTAVLFEAAAAAADNMHPCMCAAGVCSQMLYTDIQRSTTLLLQIQVQTKVLLEFVCGLKTDKT